MLAPNACPDGLNVGRLRRPSRRGWPGSGRKADRVDGRRAPITKHPQRGSKGFALWSQAIVNARRDLGMDRSGEHPIALELAETLRQHLLRDARNGALK